jgi:hypothetical protein
MNEQEGGKDTSTQADLPAGCRPEYTVLPVAGRPNVFEVFGKIHQGFSQAVYRVALGRGIGPDACECRGFRFHGTCRHLSAVYAFIETGRRSAADLAVGWFLSLSESERKTLFR